MRTRPWPLVILALLQLLSPAGTVLFNSYVLGVSPVYVIRWILDNPPLQIFETLLLMPIAGIALLQMKRWSYFVFFAAMIWGLISNLRALRYTEAFSPGFVVLLFALPMALALYFMLPSVRRTYFDPTVRWWEAKRRFLLEIPITVELTDKVLTGRIQNISEGGVALSMATAGGGNWMGNGQEMRMRFTVISVEFVVPGIVMYSMPRADGSHTYGVRFLPARESGKQMARLMKGLELIGVTHRDKDFAQPWYVGVRDWAMTVLKTGKGLIPEVKNSRKS